MSKASSGYSQLKLICIGDGAVGKTCLLIRYATNDFPKDYVPTVFDNYSLTTNILNYKYEVGFWDTAGIFFFLTFNFWTFSIFTSNSKKNQR